MLATPPSHPRRIVYLGTPPPAVPPLQALVAAGYDVPLVVTRADKKRGRGSALVPSPVKAAATELGIPTTSTIDDALDVGADLALVVAFGRIISVPVLERLPMLNIHFSLLPRWRGAAPVERAILAGDEETGVCLMAVAEGLDEGDVYARTALAIGPDESAAALRDRLVAAGTDLVLGCFASGLPDPEPQVGEPTYAAKLDPADLAIDWTSPAVAIQRQVRVGGAHTTFRGRRFKLWQVGLGEPDTAPRGPGELDPATFRVGTGAGELILEEVQPEGKARQPAAAWRNGAQLQPGDRFDAVVVAP